MRNRSILDILKEYMEKLETLTEELFPIRRPSLDIKAKTIQPLCNTSVSSTQVIITVDLPFSDPESIKVDPIDDKTLEISARMKRAVCCEDLGIIHQKGEFSTFNCQTSIPVAVDMNQRKTKFRNGILEVYLPRKKRHEKEA
jgi:HSP20 family molecular chaperone IbpA